MNKSLKIFFFSLLSFLSMNQSVQSAEGGYSNFIPGFYGDFGLGVEPDSDFLIKYDFYHYAADTNKAVRNGNIELGIDLEIYSNFLTFFYKPEIKILGAQYATALTLAYNTLNLDTSIKVGPLSTDTDVSDSGMGDLTIAPLILYWKHKNFHISFTEYIVIPTANYDDNDSLNTGLNYFSFDTNLAITYLNEETGQDYSINVGHIYNTENNDTEYQTGQEFHVHLIANQFLSENFAFGIQAFYYKQITADRGKGALLGDFEAEAMGVGPQLLFTKGSFSLILKWLHEFHAENRIEGENFYISVAYTF